MGIFKKKDPIQRDKDGKPIICDCPDGADHPCDGKGWCRPGK
jgi:hypothetical protein